MIYIAAAGAVDREFLYIKLRFLTIFRYPKPSSTSKMSPERPETSGTNPSIVFFSLWGSVSEIFCEEGSDLPEFLKFGFLQNSSRLVFPCSKSDPAEKIDIDKFF